MATAAPIPDHLNKDLFKEILQGICNSEDVVVEEFEVSLATLPGDNYLSDVYRVPVKYRVSPTAQEIQRTSFVVKCVDDTDTSFRGKVVADLCVFKKEDLMLNQVVPKLSEIAGNELFAPTCIRVIGAPNPTFILHDLEPIGFTMANRHAGLDFNHCVALMKKLGKFHAASMTFAPDNMDMMNNHFHYGMFNPSIDRTNAISGIFHNGLGTLIDIIDKEWHDFDQVILEKMKKFHPVFVEKLKKCVAQKFDDGFKVLNHGDLWCTNMMFKYDPKSNKLQDVVFVDFQLTHYTSPGIDLNYALSTCPNRETRARIDDLIVIYYQSLSETLRAINYPKVPTMADVRHEIQRMELFTLLSVLCVLPVTLMEKTNEVKVNFDNLVSEEHSKKIRRIQFSGNKYQAIVKPMLKHFYERKLFDV